jgi:hypothetical protein
MVTAFVPSLHLTMIFVAAVLYRAVQHLHACMGPAEPIPAVVSFPLTFTRHLSLDIELWNWQAPKKKE